MTDRLTIRRQRRHKARCGKPRHGAPPYGWGTLALYVVGEDHVIASMPQIVLPAHIWPLPECHRRAALIGRSRLVIGETVFRWRARVIRW